MTITTRQAKQSELTHAELDENFNDLNLRTGPGWSDLTSSILASGMPNTNAPTIGTFGPAPSLYRAYAFDLGDYCFVHPFHVNHDIKPNGQAYAHVHWSTNGANVNPVRWEMKVMRALGHNQANFGAVTTLTVTQAAHGTAWRHMVAEVDVSQTLTLTEPDELMLVVLRRIANGATDNTDLVFGLMVDFHYERDRDATPNKSPNFYI